MNILEDKIKEIANKIKSQDCNIEYIEDILNIASENYFEDDLEELIDKYEIRDFIIDNRISYINKKIMIPVKRSLMINKSLDYKVLLILMLLANYKGNTMINKFMLTFNKDKILSKYAISETEFSAGFNELVSLGIVEDKGSFYKINLKKNEGYYLILDRDICDKLVKESSRTIKTYLFMRDYLVEYDICNNSKGNMNYGIINSGTGYKDTKSLKVIIDRLIELDLVERIKHIDNRRIYYIYEIMNSRLMDCLF